LAALLVSTLLATPSAAAEWTPQAYADASTIVHHFSHPLTLRLVPEPGGEEPHH